MQKYGSIFAQGGTRCNYCDAPSGDNDHGYFQNPNKKIRVLLADDHAILRQGIGNMLRNEPDIDVVGEVGDGREAVSLAVKLLPAVVLMDMSMPNLNGEQATRILPASIRLWRADWDPVTQEGDRQS